jgi:hypothetical protein
MKKWLNEHPYLFTSVIFIIIVIFGWQFLYWRWENFALLLLLYFIVTLGIRLDDISKKIGSLSQPSSPNSAEQDSIISQLNEIKLSVKSVNVTLRKLLEQTQNGKENQNNPD